MPIYSVTEEVKGETITIYVEMDQVADSISAYGDMRGPTDAAKKVVAAARDVYGDAMDLARNCAVRVIDGIKAMDDATRPDEFEVKFAIKFDSQVGAVLAKMGTEAQLQVSMKWKRQEAA